MAVAITSPREALANNTNQGETTMNKRQPITFCQDGLLECPNCGDHYLHQMDVAVFKRKEDEQYGSTTFISHDGSVKQTNLLDGNPSPRRDGMAIKFVCELCDANLDLVIFQHKGLTKIEWICEQATPTEVVDRRVRSAFFAV